MTNTETSPPLDDAPAHERRPWQQGIAPPYITMFLLIVFYDRLPADTMAVGGLLPSLLGAILAGAGMLRPALLRAGDVGPAGAEVRGRNCRGNLRRSRGQLGAGPDTRPGARAVVLGDDLVRDGRHPARNGRWRAGRSVEPGTALGGRLDAHERADPVRHDRLDHQLGPDRHDRRAAGGIGHGALPGDSRRRAGPDGRLGVRRPGRLRGKATRSATRCPSTGDDGTDGLRLLRHRRAAWRRIGGPSPANPATCAWEGSSARAWPRRSWPSWHS